MMALAHIALLHDRKTCNYIGSGVVMIDEVDRHGGAERHGPCAGNA